MAMYYCHECGVYKDDDWHPMLDVAGFDDPICPDCFEMLECAHCGDGFDEDCDVALVHNKLPIHEGCRSYYTKDFREYNRD